MITVHSQSKQTQRKLDKKICLCFLSFIASDSFCLDRGPILGTLWDTDDDFNDSANSQTTVIAAKKRIYIKFTPCMYKGDPNANTKFFHHFIHRINLNSISLLKS